MSSKGNNDMKKIIIPIAIIVVILIIAIICLAVMIFSKKNKLKENIVDKTNFGNSDRVEENIVNPINFVSKDNINESASNTLESENSNINNNTNSTLDNGNNQYTNKPAENTILDDNHQTNISSENEPSNSENTSNFPTNSLPADLDIIAKDKSKASIALKSTELSVNGATLIITDKNKSPYAWGPGYKLQVKQDGKWNDLEPIHEMSFEEIAYELNENGQFEERIEWVNDYGTLGVGNYRVVKYINYNNSIIEFYVEFIINE